MISELSTIPNSEFRTLNYLMLDFVGKYFRYPIALVLSFVLSAVFFLAIPVINVLISDKGVKGEKELEAVIEEKRIDDRTRKEEHRAHLEGEHQCHREAEIFSEKINHINSNLDPSTSHLRCSYPKGITQLGQQVAKFRLAQDDN